MSKKKSSVPPVYAPPAPRDQARWLFPLSAFALFVFYAFLFDVGLDGAVTGKILALCICVGTVVLLFTQRARQLAGRITPLLLAVLGYALVCGISTFYAAAGKFAIKEYTVTLGSLGLLLLITALGKGGEQTARSAAAAVSGATALFSLISIDAASLGWITVGFKTLIRPFTSIYETYGGFESGARITSIFQNPNIYAGTTALGILLGLYLCLSEERPGRRRYWLALLSVNALGFLLAFSMGGTAMFALSIAAYLIAAGKGKRNPAFVLMLETALLTLAAAALSYAGLGRSGPRSAIPLLALVLNALGLILADRFLGGKLTGFLQSKGKLPALCVGGLSALLVLYLALGFLLTGSYRFAPGESLRRSAYPAPGEYTLRIEGDGSPLNVMIESQDSAQTQLHTSTVLYRGAAQDAVFTVPEETLVVYLVFSSPEGGTLEQAVLSGQGEEHSLPLKYLLLPPFAANRLQGLRANENAIQRFVFFRDGLRVFARSPIWGSGLGSFENSLFSVQDFYYTTKYVHNHYIQALADTGVIGFVFFVGILGLAAAALIRKRGTDNPCYPALWACLTMIAGHSMVEVSFSAEYFQPTAFLVFGLISLNFSTPLEKKPLFQGCRWGAAAWMTLFALLLSGNLMGKLIRTEGTLESLRSSARIDFYEKNDSKLSYVMASTSFDDPAIRRQAEAYAQDLRKVRSNSLAGYLARYYIAVGDYNGMFGCMEEGIEYTKSSPEFWQTLLVNLEYAYSPAYNPTYEALMSEREANLDRALAICGRLAELNQTQMDQIPLLARNHMLIGNLEAIRALEDQQAVDSLLTSRLFSLEHFADMDGDGLPDAVSGLRAGDGGFLAGPGSLDLKVFHDLEGAYLLTLECGDPAALTGISVGGQPVSFAPEGERLAARFTLPGNEEVAPTTITLTFGKETMVTALSAEWVE